MSLSDAANGMPSDIYDLDDGPDPELIVLGAMMQDARAADEVGVLLRADHFRSGFNVDVFIAIQAQLAAREPIELPAVFERLQRKNQVDAQSLKYLSAMVDAATSTANVAYYAGLVLERWKSRRVVDIGRRLVEDVTTHRLPSAQVIATGEESLFALGEASAGEAVSLGRRPTTPLMRSTAARRRESRAYRPGLAISTP